MATETKSKKTKAEIERDFPIIKPSECPGAIIDWVVKRDEARDKQEEERDKRLVELIEETMDRWFDKNFKKYVTMIYNNRILVIIAILLAMSSIAIAIYARN